MRCCLVEFFHGAAEAKSLYANGVKKEQMNRSKDPFSPRSLIGALTGRVGAAVSGFGAYLCQNSL